MNFLRRAVAAVSGRRLVGRDPHGNTYWEVNKPVGRPPWPRAALDGAATGVRHLRRAALVGQAMAPRPARPSQGATCKVRAVEIPSGDELDFDQDTVPKLWAAWLRDPANNPDPPTDEQMQAEASRAATMAHRVQKLEVAARQEGRAQAVEQQVSAIQGDHAAIRAFSAPGASSEPIRGTQGVFRPGEWSPAAPQGGSGASEWSSGAAEPEPEPESPALPAGWMDAHDADGKVYYFNRKTQQVQWDPPTQ